MIPNIYPNQNLEKLVQDIKNLMQNFEGETSRKPNRLQTPGADDNPSGLWVVTEDEDGEPILVPAEQTDLLDDFQGFPENQPTQTVGEYLLKKPMLTADVKPQKTVWDLPWNELNRKGRRMRGWR